MFKKISIIGPGLIGASIAMAISEKSLANQVKVWARSEGARKKCQELHWADSVHASIEEAVKDCELVVICTPVDTIISLYSKILPHLNPNTLITDVGSVKSIICEEAHSIDKDSKSYFIGSHPMAGSEKAGMQYAEAELVKGATCILTPTEGTPEDLQKKLKAFWEALGMHPFAMDPSTHDDLVAKVSHLPHIVASALAASLKDLNPDLFKFSGRGLKDTTRIAGGNAQLWESILSQNSTSILDSIDAFESVLSTIKTSLKNQDTATIHKVLEQGQVARGAIEQSN